MAVRFHTQIWAEPEGVSLICTECAQSSLGTRTGKDADLEVYVDINILHS